MNIGFNILLYGFGSKILLLNHFAKTQLNNNILIIEGYSSRLSMKEIINSILNKALNSDQSFTSSILAVYIYYNIV